MPSLPQFIFHALWMILTPKHVLRAHLSWINAVLWKENIPLCQEKKALECVHHMHYDIINKWYEKCSSWISILFHFLSFDVVDNSETPRLRISFVGSYLMGSYSANIIFQPHHIPHISPQYYVDDETYYSSTVCTVHLLIKSIFMYLPVSREIYGDVASISWSLTCVRGAPEWY